MARTRSSGTMTRGHVERAAALRAEADGILEGGLHALLSSYGSVVAHGSYALDLMVWRDLDLYLVAPELSVAQFFELGGRLAALVRPRKMRFRDERTGSEVELPAGLYWGLYAEGRPDHEWKVDLWMVKEAEAARLLAYETSVATRLSVESRHVILAIKATLCIDPRYRRSFAAKDIYEAVLEHHICDVPGFAKHIGSPL